MTPEQRYGFHRKHGRYPDEEQKPKTAAKTHAAVFSGKEQLTNPLPWALAQSKKREFEKQGIKNLKLRGI